MSLRKQTFIGLAWSFADTALIRGSAFIAQIVLARLLGPEEFGLIGMIAIFVAIGTSLVDSGMSASIIRTKNVDDQDFSTVFYTNLLISIAVYGLIWIVSAPIARFYEQPILVPIIRIYCLGFIITSFSTIQTAILIKEMRFKKIMILNIPGTLIGIFVGLIMGFTGYGVWSIVGMYLSTQISQSIMLWSFSSWKPSLIFSRDRLHFHFNFGYKLMLSGLLNTTFENIYNVIIGKFYNVRLLGYYERAYQFNQYPMATLSGIISRVTYPMLSNMHGEHDKVSNAYKKVLQLVFFITAPIMLGAAAIAKPLFLLVLGEQWAPAVPFFQILCFSGMLLPIHAFNIDVLKVYGHSDLFLKLEVAKKIIVILSACIGFRFGIYGLIWSTAITSFISLLINTYFSGRMINYSVGYQLWDMLPTFVLALLTSLIMLFATGLVSYLPLIIQLVIITVSGTLVYLLANYIFKTSPIIYLLKLIKAKL